MKTDKLFYRIFISQPSLIAELLPSVPADCTPTEAEFQRRLDLVEAILVNKFPQLSVEEVRKMLNLREANFTQTRFYQEVLEKGLQEGIQQRLQEGVQQGEASALLRILKRRCGVLSIDQQSQVRSLSIEQLESLADVLLGFTGITDLENWLKTHNSI